MIETPNIPSDSKPVEHSKEFEEVVRARRSVRQFLEDPIPEDIVEKCLELALLAPTSSNLQCWEFHRIKSSELREKLNHAFFNQPAVRKAPELIIAVARTRTWKRSQKLMLETFEKQENVPEAAWDYYKKLVPMVYDNGPLGIKGFLKKIVFGIMGFFRVVPREPTNEAELRTWAVKTTALACENLMLAFSSYGYDTCPMEGFDSKRVKKLLGLPRDAVLVMGVSAGKRAEGGIYGPRIRFDKDLFLFEH